MLSEPCSGERGLMLVLRPEPLEMCGCTMNPCLFIIAGWQPYKCIQSSFLYLRVDVDLRVFLRVCVRLKGKHSRYEKHLRHHVLLFCCFPENFPRLSAVRKAWGQQTSCSYDPHVLLFFLINVYTEAEAECKTSWSAEEVPHQCKVGHRNTEKKKQSSQSWVVRLETA